MIRGASSGVFYFFLLKKACTLFKFGKFCRGDVQSLLTQKLGVNISSQHFLAMFSFPQVTVVCQFQ